jgi:hypothetical protein
MEVFMRAPAPLRESYAGSPVLFTVALVVAAVLGLYWGYRIVGPFLLG